MVLCFSDLGVHIDGYIAVCAQTFVIGAQVGCAATGRQGDVILAAHAAAYAAASLLKPGNKSQDVTKAISDIAKAYNCTPVAG